MRVLNWKIADGEKCVEARLVARGYPYPDSKDGNVDAGGRASLCSPHLRVISLGVIEKWKICSLHIKTAFLHADGFSCDVFFVLLRKGPLARPTHLEGTCAGLWLV